MASKKLNPKKKKNRESTFFKNLEKIVLPILIFGIFLFVYQYTFDSKMNINGDNASYFLLGKSIQTNQVYALYNDVNLNPQNHFPPGYPLLLSFFMLFSKNLIFLKIITGLFYLGSIYLLFYFFQKFKVSWQLAFVTIIFILINYHITTFSVRLMSEIPFLFFSLLSLWFLQKMNLEKAFHKDPNFWYCLLSLSFAFHIRTAGVALLGGMIFYLLLEKEWKRSVALLGGFSFLMVPWILRGKILGLSSGYQSQLFKINSYQPELGNAGLGDFMVRFGENLSRYISKEIPSGILSFRDVSYTMPSEFMDWTIGILLLILIILGIVFLPRFRSLIIGYLGGSLLILMFWPSVWKGTRFIVPLLPFMIFLIVIGISGLFNKILVKTRLNLNWTPFLLLPFIFAFTQNYRASERGTEWGHYPFERLHLEAERDYGLGWKNYLAIAEYVKKNTKETAIVACRKPQFFHIFSDRFTCYYPYESDSEKMIEELKKRKVKYVVLEQLGFSTSGQYLVPAINEQYQHFREILHLENPDSYLFEFIPPK